MASKTFILIASMAAFHIDALFLDNVHHTQNQGITEEKEIHKYRGFVNYGGNDINGSYAENTNYQQVLTEVDEGIEPTPLDSEVPSLDVDLPIMSTHPLETVPSTSSAPVEDRQEFDPDMLQILENVDSEIVEYGEDLQAGIAKSFQTILMNGLKKESREELFKKHLIPKNVPLAKAPILNPEINAMLPENRRWRDKRLLNKQDQLGRALSAVGNAMTGLMKKTPDIPEVLRTLNDAAKLVADSHFIETDTRRSVIIPLVDKYLTDPFKDRKRDTMLFGENLGEVVKNSQGIKKTSQLINANNNEYLNWRGPPTASRGRQFRHPSYQMRLGGQRQQPNRRRAGAPLSLPTPPPPPAPVRRRHMQAATQSQTLAPQAPRRQTTQPTSTRTRY